MKPTPHVEKTVIPANRPTAEEWQRIYNPATICRQKLDHLAYEWEKIDLERERIEEQKENRADL